MKKFFTQPSKNASIWPTSENASELLCQSVKREDIQTIVELGPGTGPVTDQIFRFMLPETNYYGIEYEADFVVELQEKGSHSIDDVLFNETSKT